MESYSSGAPFGLKNDRTTRHSTAKGNVQRGWQGHGGVGKCNWCDGEILTSATSVSPRGLGTQLNKISQ